MEPEPTCGECSYHYADRDACLASGEEGGYYKDTKACELFIPKPKTIKDFATDLEIPTIKLDEEQNMDTNKLTCSMCVYYYLYRDKCPNLYKFENGTKDGRSHVCNAFKWLAPKTVSASDLVYRTIDHDRSTPETDDPVHHPSHYTQGEVECIDAIRSSMAPTEFRGYLKGQVLKYIWRYDKKNNPFEDLRKAVQYLNWLVDEITEA